MARSRLMHQSPVVDGLHLAITAEQMPAEQRGTGSPLPPRPAEAVEGLICAERTRAERTRAKCPW